MLSVSSSYPNTKTKGLFGYDEETDSMAQGLGRSDDPAREGALKVHREPTDGDWIGWERGTDETRGPPKLVSREDASIYDEPPFLRSQDDANEYIGETLLWRGSSGQLFESEVASEATRGAGLSVFDPTGVEQVEWYLSTSGKQSESDYSLVGVPPATGRDRPLLFSEDGGDSPPVSGDEDQKGFKNERMENAFYWAAQASGWMVDGPNAGIGGTYYVTVFGGKPTIVFDGDEWNEETVEAVRDGLREIDFPEPMTLRELDEEWRLFINEPNDDLLISNYVDDWTAWETQNSFSDTDLRLDGKDDEDGDETNSMADTFPVRVDAIYRETGGTPTVDLENEDLSPVEDDTIDEAFEIIDLVSDPPNRQPSTRIATIVFTSPTEYDFENYVTTLNLESEDDIEGGFTGTPANDAGPEALEVWRAPGGERVEIFLDRVLINGIEAPIDSDEARSVVRDVDGYNLLEDNRGQIVPKDLPETVADWGLLPQGRWDNPRHPVYLAREVTLTLREFEDSQREDVRYALIAESTERGGPDAENVVVTGSAQDLVDKSTEFMRTTSPEAVPFSDGDTGSGPSTTTVEPGGGANGRSDEPVFGGGDERSSDPSAFGITLSDLPVALQRILPGVAVNTNTRGNVVEIVQAVDSESGVGFDRTPGVVTGDEDDLEDLTLRAVDAYDDAVEVNSLDVEDTNQQRQASDIDAPALREPEPDDPAQNPNDTQAATSNDLSDDESRVLQQVVNTVTDESMPKEARQREASIPVEELYQQKYPDLVEYIGFLLSYNANGNFVGIEIVIGLTTAGERRIAGWGFFERLSTLVGANDLGSMFSQIDGIITALDTESPGNEEVKRKLSVMEDTERFDIQTRNVDLEDLFLSFEEIDTFAKYNNDLVTAIEERTKRVSRAWSAGISVNDAATGNSEQEKVIQQKLSTKTRYRQGSFLWYLDKAYSDFQQGGFDPVAFLRAWYRADDRGGPGDIYGPDSPYGKKDRGPTAAELLADDGPDTGEQGSEDPDPTRQDPDQRGPDRRPDPSPEPEPEPASEPEPDPSPSPSPDSSPKSPAEPEVERETFEVYVLREDGDNRIGLKRPDEDRIMTEETDPRVVSPLTRQIDRDVRPSAATESVFVGEIRVSDGTVVQQDLDSPRRGTPLDVLEATRGERRPPQADTTPDRDPSPEPDPDPSPGPSPGVPQDIREASVDTLQTGDVDIEELNIESLDIGTFDVGEVSDPDIDMGSVDSIREDIEDGIGGE